MTRDAVEIMKRRYLKTRWGRFKFWLARQWQRFNCWTGEHGGIDDSESRGLPYWGIFNLRQYQPMTCGWCGRDYDRRLRNPRPFGG